MPASRPTYFNMALYREKCCLFNIYLFIFGKSYSEGEIPHTLVHFPSGCIGHGWARPRPGAQKSIPRGQQGPTTWAIFCYFPRHISRKLECKQSNWDLKRHHNMECWQCRQWLNLLWHNTSLKTNISIRPFMAKKICLYILESQSYRDRKRS